MTNEATGYFGCYAANTIPEEIVLGEARTLAGVRMIMSIKVEVHGDIEKAIRFFRKKVQRDGILREVRQRQYYLKPSIRKKHKRLIAERRRRNALRRSLPYNQ